MSATPSTAPANGNTEKHVLIAPKAAFDFEAIKKRVMADQWRKFAVEIQIREKMHGGKPFALDAAKAMLKARGLEEIVEAREALISAEERAVDVVDEGLCGFHRRADKAGLWWPSNNFKACLKENGSVLGYNMDARPQSKRKPGASEGADADTELETAPEIPAAKGKKTAAPKSPALRGFRGAMHEGVFVVSANPNDLDWIYLGEEPDGIDQNVSHTIGPKGPQSSIKRNEYMWKPKFSLEIWIAKPIAAKIADEVLVHILMHAQEHGIGANRSQGVGKFDVLSCVEI